MGGGGRGKRWLNATIVKADYIKSAADLVSGGSGGRQLSHLTPSSCSLRNVLVPRQNPLLLVVVIFFVEELCKINCLVSGVVKPQMA